MPTETLWQLIQADPDLSLFSSAVQSRPELVALLSRPEPLTLFLPTDAALAAMPEWSGISADDELLSAFVNGHAVNGALTSPEVLASFELTALSGDTLVIDGLAGTVNGRHFVTADTEGTNGYLHTMDGPLVNPPTTTTTTSDAGTTTTTIV